MGEAQPDENSEGFSGSTTPTLTLPRYRGRGYYESIVSLDSITTTGQSGAPVSAAFPRPPTTKT
ncbi:hypothetical protein CCP1ISM_1360002 [Azospirillaceae bacterium]